VTACEHVRPAIGAYLLGALDAAEAEEVRRHLERCPDCAAEHDALAPVPGLLSVAGGAEAATAEPLPPAFEERLLDAFATERALQPARRRLARLRRRPRLRWMAAGLATATVAAVAVALVLGGGEQEAPSYDVVLRGVGTASAASAGVELESLEAEGTELHMWVRDLPTGTPAVYEVLCEAPGLSASAGTFRVDATGGAYVVLTTAARRGEYDSIRVVRRTRSGDGQLVTSDVLAARL
jgi:anti-sigma factor RsiW